MDTIGITLQCPDCNGEGIQPMRATPEFDRATEAVTQKRGELHAATKRHNDADPGPFGSEEDNARWYATWEQYKGAADALTAAQQARDAVTPKFLPRETCPRCKRAGTVTAPTDIGAALSWIIAELARMDQERAGGEPNARRIFDALAR